MASTRRWTAFLVLSLVSVGVVTAGAACSSREGDDDPFDGASAAAGRGSGGGDIGLGKGGTSSDAEAGAPGTPENGGSSGRSGPSGTAGASVQPTTGNACDNGKDDDGDGLVDGFDPECTGPLDDDEGTFATGIPGDNRDPKWQDCFFDGNSGAGEDGCRYSTDCLYGKLSPDDEDCQVSDQCLKFCEPLTQNGCDCFGCCTIQTKDGGTIDVLEGASCSLANLDDPKACPRCTKSHECSNECGECELCPGKTTLPASCNPPPTGAGGGSGVGGASGAGGAPNVPPPVYTCDNGEQVCGPGLPPCANSFEYCALGCCIAAVR